MGPRMQDGMSESSSRSRDAAVDSTFYAEHLAALLRKSNAWLRRMVASYTIVDADTIQLRMSVDFDLTECPEGLCYLGDIEAERRRYSEEHRREGQPKLTRNPIRFLLPIGLYSDPYVGFDLRDSCESRLNLIIKKESDKILGSTKFKDQIEEDGRLGRILASGHLAIAELSSTYDSGRGVLHYTHLVRWRPDRKAFRFLPPAPEKDRKIRRPTWFTRTWWRRTRAMLGWRPLRVVIPLLNVYLCESYHIELVTPEGMRIHRASIVANRGAGRQKVVSQDPTKVPTDIPPSHAYAATHHYQLRKLNGYPLIFRAWLCLDRRGFTSLVLFLAILNFLVSLGSLAAVIPFRTPGPDISALVPVLMLTATASFAYLYVPGEHGMIRGIYSYVRRMLFAIATSTLIIAADLSILNSYLSPLKPPTSEGKVEFIIWAFNHLGPLGDTALILAAVIVALMFAGAVVLFITWWKARDRKVARWVDKKMKSHEYKQFGWHTVEPINIKFGPID
jgi:hypothetical protein